MQVFKIKDSIMKMFTIVYFSYNDSPMHTFTLHMFGHYVHGRSHCYKASL